MGGGAISNRLVVAAVIGILMVVQSLLNKHWARSLADRMGFVQRKATTATSKYTEANFVRCCLNSYYGRHPSRTNHKLGPDKNKDGPMYRMDSGKAGHKACGANRGER